MGFLVFIFTKVMIFYAFGVVLPLFISQGRIVPLEVVFALMKKAMIASGSSKFLIDGFPRALGTSLK